MKKYLFILTVICLSIPVFAQTLSSPESIVIDYSNSYQTDHTVYVSNAGNGQILKRPYSGTEYTVFASGLGSVRGLFIREGILYGASSQGLVRYNLSTGQSIGTVQIIGSTFLNDVVADSSGNIYISDNQAHKIFKYEIVAGVVSIFVGANIQSPNGMVFDSVQNRLLLVSFRANSPIQAIQLPGGEVSLAAETNLGNLDGIGIDDNRCIYFSSWQTNSVYRMSSISAVPVQVWTGLSGPADFFITRKTGLYTKNEILIPKMNANSVVSYHLPNFIRDFDVLYLLKYPDLGVQWRSYFELGLDGYYVYINTDGINDFAQAEFALDDFIPAQNIANAEYGPFYGIDAYFPYWNQLWWIRMIETDGAEHIFGPYEAIWVENSDNIAVQQTDTAFVYPNPLSDKSVLVFELEKSENVGIDIFDVKGRRILQKNIGTFSKGKQEIALSQLGLKASELAGGVYLCMVRAGNRTMSSKLTVVKR